jgi:predicted RNase H-like nuclease (RuvC/YqgF family)
MIESLVAILLVVTIGYCMVLNSRLKRLKADEQSLKATIAELITATEMAERAVAGLKTTAHEAEATLGERLKSADRCCAELTRQVKAGDSLANRLGRAVAAGRSHEDALPATAGPPDPKAVAAAARSFADRLRERMSVLAA